MFPGLAADDLPHSEGWAVERLSVTTHNGTHVDAPYHYASTMNGGERAWTIDEMPLDWFFRPGLKLDFRDFADGHVVTAKELEAAIQQTGHLLQPLDIVLMNTCAGATYGTPQYLASGCGFGKEATLWLADRGVRVVGTDAWSWDAPFAHTRKRYEESKDASIIWEGHKAGLLTNYCQIEKMANLDKLPHQRLPGMYAASKHSRSIRRLGARGRYSAGLDHPPGRKGIYPAAASVWKARVSPLNKL